MISFMGVSHGADQSDSLMRLLEALSRLQFV